VVSHNEYQTKNNFQDSLGYYNLPGGSKHSRPFNRADVLDNI